MVFLIEVRYWPISVLAKRLALSGDAGKADVRVH
jgi:hypothetical protein